MKSITIIFLFGLLGLLGWGQTVKYCTHDYGPDCTAIECALDGSICIDRGAISPNTVTNNIKAKPVEAKPTDGIEPNYTVEPVTQKIPHCKPGFKLKRFDPEYTATTFTNLVVTPELTFDNQPHPARWLDVPTAPNVNISFDNYRCFPAGDSHPLGKKGAGLWDTKPLDCIGCGLGTSESITYEGNIGLGVGVMVSSVDPKHPIVDLRFVQIRADIKYCDDHSGDDQDCVIHKGQSFTLCKMGEHMEINMKKDGYLFSGCVKGPVVINENNVHAWGKPLDPIDVTTMPNNLVPRTPGECYCPKNSKVCFSGMVDDSADDYLECIPTDVQRQYHGDPGADCSDGSGGWHRASNCQRYLSYCDDLSGAHAGEECVQREIPEQDMPQFAPRHGFDSRGFANHPVNLPPNCKDKPNARPCIDIPPQCNDDPKAAECAAVVRRCKWGLAIVQNDSWGDECGIEMPKCLPSDMNSNGEGCEISDYIVPSTCPAGTHWAKEDVVLYPQIINAMCTGDCTRHKNVFVCEK